MTTKNFFIAELGVQFTMDELHTIASALATDSFDHRESKRMNLAEESWRVRKKVVEYMQHYNNL